MRRIKRYSDLMANESNYTLTDIIDYRREIDKIDSKYERIFSDRITDIMNTWLGYYEFTEDNEQGEMYGEFNFLSRDVYRRDPIILGNGSTINSIYYRKDRGWVVTGAYFTHLVTELSTSDLSIILDGIVKKEGIMKYYNTVSLLKKINN